ncbi:LysR family transcriptional regulator [Paenibacillus abyssi]|uniref:HTH-type transcriptional regulator YxjO n=1 Tax=Paenibacillus abyssi TaxID=1340531 RepID=A0A917CXD2_9BACL|nr:LysR family transcriptional regulator [Paenibacillus abyssi]GGG00993.1 putative HTH-type transcriptional regulator YxjO [Paenibacillus abyssi]
MDIDLLQTFQRVAALQSISKAADDLYLSVSTVTGRIKSLEEELNVELFHRAGRRFELSKDGKRFLSYVDRFISILQEGNQKVKLSKEGRTGELSVAVTPIVASYVLPRFIREFRLKYPQIGLRVVACPNYQVIEKVNNGQAELGIIYANTAEKGLSFHPWYEDEWMFVAPDRSLLQGKPVTATDLRHVPLLAYGKGHPEWDAVLRWYQLEGIRPKVIMELVHMETLKQLMKEFRAVAFLPRVSVMEEIADGTFAQVPISPGLSARSEISFAYRNNQQLSVTAHTFFEFAAHYADNLLP